MDHPIAADAPSDWRFAIRAYLDAQWEDQRRRHEADLQNCEARCLREFAAENVCRDHERMIRHRLGILEMPSPESSIQVVQEDPQRVVALVETCVRDSQMRLLTRFTLAWQDAGWKIVAISVPCFGCSPLVFHHLEGGFTPQVGLCRWCEGSGKTKANSTPWRWFFLRRAVAPTPCKACDGKRICQRCIQSLEKGWMNAFFSEAVVRKQEPRGDP